MTWRFYAITEFTTLMLAFLAWREENWGGLAITIVATIALTAYMLLAPRSSRP